MKKIYTVTLNEDEVPSEFTASDIRLVGYFLCGILDSFETAKGKPVMYSGDVKPNDLFEVRHNGNTFYRLTSDNPKIKNKLEYEPFIVDDNTFGFTVLDDTVVNYSLIITELNKVLNSLEKRNNLKRYTFNVSEIDFEESIESREEAIERMVFNNIPEKEIYPPVAKKRILTKVPLMGILGR